MPGVNLGETTESEPHSVWILDADVTTRGLVQRILERQGLHVVAFAAYRSFLDSYRPGRAQCLILDSRLPDGDGLTVQRELTAVGDLLPLVFLTAAADVPTAVAAMKGGAADFFLKPFDPAVLVLAVQGAIARAKRYRTLQETAIAVRRLQTLTGREREVLDLVVAGYSTKQISAKLHRVDKTVEFHRQNIMRKLGATNVAHLVRLVTTADHALVQRNGNGHLPAIPRRC